MAWARLRPWRTALMLVAGVGVLMAAGSAGAADSLAARMLAAAIVPAGAVQVPFLPGSVFVQPSEQPACSPLIDEARYWVVAGDPAGVAAFLKAHPPSGLVNAGTGWLGSTGGQTISYEVADAPRGTSFGAPAGLDFTVAALPGGLTGIRADAELVPPDAGCSESGSATLSG